jgi:rhodanese-related sulfurtransferase
MQNTLTSVEPSVFYKEMNENTVPVIDLRTPREFDMGHIQNVINIDYYSPNFLERLDVLNRNEPYLIYCYSGSRSYDTLQIMKRMGFTNVLDLSGGTIAWEMNGFPLVR